MTSSRLRPALILCGRALCHFPSHHPFISHPLLVTLSRLRRNPRLAIRDLDTQRLRLRSDLHSLSRTHSVRDLRGVCSVVHEEEVDVFGVVYKEGSVTGGHHVLRLLVRAEADLKELPRQPVCSHRLRLGSKTENRLVDHELQNP